jgi:hypothetical protein
MGPVLPLPCQDHADIAQVEFAAMREEYRVGYMVDGSMKYTGVFYSLQAAELAAKEFKGWCRLVVVQKCIEGVWRALP